MAEADVEAIFHVFVLAWLREKFGDGLLMFFEDAHAETLLFEEIWEHQRFLVYADQDQQRIQGDRGEGIGGHAVNFAGLVLNADDRYAGGELAEGLAES